MGSNLPDDYPTAKAMVPVDMDFIHTESHGLPARTLAAIHAPPMPQSCNDALRAVADGPGEVSVLDVAHRMNVVWAVGHADALMARLAETEAPR